MQRVKRKLIDHKGITITYEYTYLCEKCDKEFKPQNIHTVKYCDKCKVIVKREAAKERMRTLRAKRKENL